MPCPMRFNSLQKSYGAAFTSYPITYTSLKKSRNFLPNTLTDYQMPGHLSVDTDAPLNK